MSRQFPGCLAALCGLAIAASCDASPDASRAAWLQATLVHDNWGDLSRTPDLAGAKFERMGDDVYAFMRGSLGQFRRDLEAPVGFDTRTRYLTAEASTVQIVGDPHIENIGTFRLENASLAVEFNDFDAAAYGAYHTDVWRLATSWHTFGLTASFSKLSEAQWLDVAEATARGYADEIAALAESPGLELDMTRTAVFEDLVEEAQEDGEDLSLLERYTEVGDDGRRAFLFGEGENSTYASIVPLTAQELRWLEASLDSWRASLPLVELGARLDAGRRYGSGVASIAVLRYYLLFDGPSSDAKDDILIEWKEARDPILIGTNAVQLGRLFPSNAQRITVMQRRAHAIADSDAYAGWHGEEPWSFRSRRRSGYHKGFDRDRILRRLRDGRWDLEEVLQAGYATGQLLAHSHARTETLDGHNSALAIADAIAGDAIGFAREARDISAAMGARIEMDFRLFKRLLNQRGSLLGFSP